MVDPAAEFLLDLAPDNLYDRTPESWVLRCRYCGKNVNHWDRAQHHAAHRRDVSRAASKTTQEKREAALVKARAAKAKRKVDLPFIHPDRN